MGESKLKIGAIVVLYNSPQDDFQNILNYVHDVDITIIMDNSPQSCDNALSSLFSIDNDRVRYHHYPNNLGLCKALNIGIRELADSGCEWTLVMNLDSSFKTNILDVYKGYLQTHDGSNIAILGPVYDYDRKKAAPYDGTKSVKRIMMSGNLIHIEIFEHLGGYEEQLFVDGLDWEYCLHAKKCGYEIIECGQAVLNHKPAITRQLCLFGKPILKYGIASPQRYYYMGRASIWLFRKYHEPYDFLEWCYRIVKILLLFPQKKAYLKSYSQGTKEGLEMSVS